MISWEQDGPLGSFSSKVWVGWLGSPFLWSLLPRPELPSWGPGVQGPRGSCSKLDSGHSLHMASPGGLPCYRLTHPGHGSGTLLAFGLASGARKVLIIPGSPTQDLLELCEPSHVCEARCPVGSGTGVSAAAELPGEACVPVWHMENSFRVHTEGRKCMTLSSTICLSRSCLRASLPTSLDARGPGATE